MTPRRDDENRRHWRAFWDEVPGWAKAALIGLGTFSVGGYAGGYGKTLEPLEAKIRDLELSKVRMETTLETMSRQLDRIERKLDRRGGTLGSKPIEDREG
jgi:hypothetical protein